MARFPFMPERVPTPAPVMGRGAGPATVSFLAPSAGGDATGGQTLDALMLRQRQLAEQSAQMAQPNTQNNTIAGGMGTMLDRFMAGRAEATNRDQQTAGRDSLATLMAGIDPAAGPSQQQIADIGRLDPEAGQRLYEGAVQARAAAAAEKTRLGERVEDRGFAVADREDAQAAALAASTAKAGQDAAPKLSDIASIRGDFAADPAVKNMKNAAPIWASVQDANTRDTPQADLNIIIGMAKLFDPTSVVRTEEGEAVKQTGNLPSNLFSQYQYLTGQPGARLSPEIRAGLLAEGGSRMKGYQDAYKGTADYFTAIAGRHGVNPADIVQELGAPEAPDAPPAPDEVEAEIKRRGLNG